MFTLPENAQHIIKDERIQVRYSVNNQTIKRQMRRVVVYLDENNTIFICRTNNYILPEFEIAAIYENRLQIETFVQKLK